MVSIVYRPLAADEFDLFNRYATPPTSGVGARSRTFDEFVAAGDYRPEWTWVALDGGDVIARAAFWGPPGVPHPFSLDWFDPGTGPDRIDVGARLLQAAYAAVATPDYWSLPHPDGGRPDYLLFLPADWRERAEATADAMDRINAAEQAGLFFSRERVNVRWVAGQGLPNRSGRLNFAPVTDRQQLLTTLARVCEHSLDVEDQRQIAEGGPETAAQAIMDEVASMPGGSSRWRLAMTRSNEIVGVVMPTRNPSSATIGYLGVVPEHRGRGYVDDLISEALHQFDAEDEPVVNDQTDAANTPMLAAFDRCGYRVTGRRVVMI
ncbi:GNAT family N-acetyltransferase [Phytoactinopolyspora mesophila]|uniref:GNAT family N-acetyltransferase n=1 Tax=Phytoactinopolyspora mesophila TaxID=2650750 RepID=A0A7K3LYJ7_9ACTN|nr:GNAT family N-acetyltransferase [Phytoactinopolyspora mesophila]NDL56079.1 GNAT family N-acetyltransferase [Phytoactinopolyspora mesophila]